MKNNHPAYAALLALLFPIACSDTATDEPDGTGGSVSTGGDPATGGAVATGGSSATGGAVATGGSGPTGGTAATGGDTATGGVEATGGTNPTGGAEATGGMGGSMGNQPPELTVTLDDMEAHNVGANPTTFGWSKGDIVGVTDAEANSGTKSIIFFDDDGGESPEMQAEYTAASRGVIKASIYMVPDLVSPLEAYFTIYSDSASQAFRLADYRFAGDGDVHWRTTATGSWGNTTLTFPTEQWVDIEIAWDMESGDGGESWVTVAGQTVGPLALYAKSQSTVLGIKFGGTDDVSDAATFYVDDLGYSVE